MKRKNNIDGISIRNFIEHYLGTKHDCSKLKHQGLKSFNNPYLIGVSNNFAFNNYDYVIKNELVIVIDDYGNPGTYINPCNIKKLIELEICREKLKIIGNISYHSFKEANHIYSIWNELCQDIKYLEGLYGSTCTYELLFILDKWKVIRNIKKIAKEEATRTLDLTNNKNNLDINEEVSKYENISINIDSNTDNCILPIDPLESYEVTEKINRQKRLNYNKKIS